ncbi:hypothetical protein E4T56_gene20495 [Termitomyces sp. T112]|nr:hypothetical protein E4T56_gene20495 [Termitomyces sp. T112]KAH0588441.1 hypothetical protein H2248_004287 [Termitomyces sp. 'cryptogamus']
MALTTAANLATIGSFAVDFFSLGFLTVNKQENIREPLVEANDVLHDVIDRITNYSVYLDDKEFDQSMKEYGKARRLVDTVLQDRSSFDNFIVRARRYHRNRIQANKAKLKSQKAYDFVIELSARAKRRVDIEQQKIDQYTRKARLERFAKVDFKLPDSDENLAATKDSELEVAQPPSPTPSRSCNESYSPFRDPHLKEIPWKTETTLSLQSFTSD